MRLKHLLAGLLVALLAALALLVAPRQAAQQSSVSVEVPYTVQITVKVVRDGRVVQQVEKTGDPLLYNFWALILNSFLGRYYNSPLAIYRVDGTTFTQPDWEYITASGQNPLLAVGFGSGSQSVSFYDYEVPSLIARVDVPSSGYSLTDNGSAITVSATASYTASSAVTVTTVGLYWGGFSFNSGTRIYVLIARDLLPSPVSLLAGDVLIVTYTISVRYDTAPMLKNLAALIINYVLGAKYYNRAVSFVTTDGTGTNVMDIGVDYYGGSDYVKEYLYIGVTDTVMPYSPGLSTVSQLSITSSGVTVSMGNNSTHVWFSLPSSTILLASGGTVRAFYAVIQSTDINGGDTNTAKNVLVLFFPLSDPVVVPAGSGVRVSFTIYFRWA